MNDDSICPKRIKNELQTKNEKFQFIKNILGEDSKRSRKCFIQRSAIFVLSIQRLALLLKAKECYGQLYCPTEWVREMN
jgi:hypothetical protein